VDLFIDIETVPLQRGIDEFKERVNGEIKPPASLKKLETIEAWYADEHPRLIEEAYLKTSLNGTLGEIAVIGWAVDDSPVNTLYGVSGQTEADVLRTFFDALRDQVSQRIPRKVGHNILGFDLRFLFQRAVINGVKPTIPMHHDARYNGEYVFDTMLAWAGWGKYIKQAELCAALGLPCSKGDLDGSKVWPMIQAGRIKEVAEYCAGDVEDVRRVYRKMQFMNLPAMPA
jgi:hypothetical protein